jgi:hypothetical protein
MTWRQRFARCSTLAGTLVGVLLFAEAADAEPARFETRNLSVIARATELVDEYAGKQYPLGTSLQLTRKSSAAARSMRERNFQIRMFALAADQFVPEPWAFFDPCYVYYSMVFSIRGSTDEAIDLVKLRDPVWLTPIRGRKIERGRYLLLFEQATDTEPFFRLNKTERDAYFKSGLYIEVVPVREYPQETVDELAEQLERRRAEIEPQARVNDASLPCYRYRVVGGAGSASDERIAFLESCDPS